MKYPDILTDLSRISFYTAPASHSPEPFQISPGVQLVEVILSGVVYFEVNQIKRLCRRGTIFWHIAGDSTIYETTREEPYTCLVLHFRCSQDQRIAPRVSFWRGSDSALDEFAKTVYNSFVDCRNEPSAEILYKYCANELLMHTYKIAALHANAPVPLASAGEHLLLRNILNYIENNLAGDLSVKTLAAALKIPRNKLFALFKTELQQSPHDYILQKRLQHACTLLESSNTTLKEIAAVCGFEYMEVFHRNFVKYFNETPQNYRKSHAPYREL